MRSVCIMANSDSQRPVTESCKDDVKTTGWRTNRRIAGEPLARVLLLIALGCALAGAAPRAARKASAQAGTIVISGTVTQSDAFCGGTAPPVSMSTPPDASRPFPNKTFHLVEGATRTPGGPVLGRFTSDAAGRFSFRLAPGTYSILVDEQISPPEAKRYEARFVRMDEACFKDWWAKPYSILEVRASDISGLRFHFNHRCFIQYDIPCLQYVGPRPP